MRRITIWLTVTAAVVAMAFYFQLSLSGTGKAGEEEHTATEQVAAPDEVK